MRTKLFDDNYISGFRAVPKTVSNDYIRVTGPEGLPYPEPGHPGTVEALTPKRNEKLFLRLLIIGALLLLYIFIKWFFNGRNIGYYPLYVLLCISFGYKVVKLLFEWYHYWSVDTAPSTRGRNTWTVDMLTTAMPGEPYEMIENTLRAMVGVSYPHTTYLCDEGDDPALRQLCAALGVVHVTRQLKTNAKAGNINNALKQATGDICVVLDPDHAPLPQFLDEVLPYFDDPAIGYVQVAQVYKNAGDTWIAQGAAQQTYVFYGPMMMGMNRYGTSQAIGANCTFRREALDSIGGHAAGLSEDMHTAMRLHAAGWKSVYKPGIVARGLVPANIGAYYKQQLKWSRGTFELLFAVFPVLFTRFSLRQKLHYFLLPFHFAAGIIALIDILVPVIVLFSGQAPLYFNTNELFWVLVPLFLLTMLIRQYAQRWLLEKHERGFHLAGGILLFGTWWVYTVGFVYTLLRIKVPYIPTPKEDDRSNNLVLHIPNIIVCLLCITAVVYGLSSDWNPYNFVAAGFCLLTVCMLGAVILASQQLLLLAIKNNINKLLFIPSALQYLQKTKEYSLSAIYRFLRRGAPLLGGVTLCGAILFFCLRIQENAGTSMYGEAPVQKKEGGFYTGIYLPELQTANTLAPLRAFEKAARSSSSIVSLYESWGPASLDKFPLGLMNAIADRGSIPMITWEPWIEAFTAQKGLAAIASGRLDGYIHAYAAKIRDYHKPVFIRFAHEPGNPAYPWSATGGNTPDDYKAAWHKVVDLFRADGAGNVTWVWNPWSAATMASYYPGDAYVDWIGITCLNYGLASWNGQWHSFESVYNPYRKTLLAWQKPVMLAEFGSTNYGGQAGEWLTHALQVIHDDYTEIRSFVFFNSNTDKNWISSWRPQAGAAYIDWSVRRPDLLAAPLAAFKKTAFHYDKASDHGYPAPIPAVKPASLKGAPGSWTLLSHGRPFYIKGIAYNPGQDWRDGHHPLTIGQLEKDFAGIKQTGCNTILRSRPSVYDRNILKVAQEYDLKLIYGFWFSPQADYYKDSAQVNEYLQEVDEKVAQYKTSPQVLAWCIGDQTGSGLEHYYAQPYLGLVRNAYRAMIERMAQTIHRLDTVRPVITALEDSRQLPAELLAWRRQAPSVDIIGINACYEQQLSTLPSLMTALDSTRPWLVTAFGPKGYWDSRYTDDITLPKEDNDLLKAGQYANAWNNHILNNKGSNIGGIATCWQDRYDGSATWFGITDYKGRRKAGYYALQQVWTGTNKDAPEIPGVFLVGPGFPLYPGQYYAFTAVGDAHTFRKLEWHLYREDCINEVKGIVASGKINKIWITLPSGKGRYRLYVYLDDDHGNVVTASIPLIPFKGIYNNDL